jgi:plasmid maintenance system antidote protein VapI
VTPNELRALLTRAGLSQRGAARELHINERTMRGYCAGQQPVPRTVELALKFLAAEHARTQ